VLSTKPCIFTATRSVGAGAGCNTGPVSDPKSSSDELLTLKYLVFSRESCDGFFNIFIFFTYFFLAMRIRAKLWIFTTLLAVMLFSIETSGFSSTTFSCETRPNCE
jgi:hypothetical protein